MAGMTVLPVRSMRAAPEGTWTDPCPANGGNAAIPDDECSAVDGWTLIADNHAGAFKENGIRLGVDGCESHQCGKDVFCQ
jgi:hypothetical protein